MALSQRGDRDRLAEMRSAERRTDELRLLCWPFHNGLRNVSMGSGATVLAADQPLRAAIEDAGWRVSDQLIDGVDESRPEIVRVIELIRRLAAATRNTVDEGAFPLVLAGNCNSCLGTTAGIGAENLGVVWFDAHADFDDPEENASGFFDVMGLAMLTGRGWRALRSTIPGHAPIPEQNVILAGVRDLEPYQRQRLTSSALTTIPGPIDRDQFTEAVDRLRDRVERIYVHVDLDSIDLADAQANEYAAPGGPRLDHLIDCLRIASAGLPVAGAAITAYDPAFDQDGRTLDAARRISAELATGIRPQRTPNTS